MSSDQDRTPSERAERDTPVDKGSRPQPKPVWVLGGALERWWELALALREVGIEIKPVNADADLTTVASRARCGHGVIVVDLADNIERGIAAITVCRSASPRLPIVAVVKDPSLELSQRLRGLGVLSLATPPLDAGRLGKLLDDTFRELESDQPTGPVKQKILVIDDDRDVRTSVRAFLESEGFAVSCAATGAEGLEKAVQEKPDLIVLDVMMENLWAGYEVNQTLKFRSGYETARRIPIVMVSSIKEHPAERFARSAEAAMVCPDVYLTKPLDLTRFLETVRSLLAKTKTGVPRPSP